MSSRRRHRRRAASPAQPSDRPTSDSYRKPRRHKTQNRKKEPSPPPPSSEPIDDSLSRKRKKKRGKKRRKSTETRSSKSDSPPKRSKKEKRKKETESSTKSDPTNEDTNKPSPPTPPPTPAKRQTFRATNPEFAPFSTMETVFYPDDDSDRNQLTTASSRTGAALWDRTQWENTPYGRSADEQRRTDAMSKEMMNKMTASREGGETTGGGQGDEKTNVVDSSGLTAKGNWKTPTLLIVLRICQVLGCAACCGIGVYDTTVRAISPPIYSLALLAHGGVTGVLCCVWLCIFSCCKCHTSPYRPDRLNRTSLCLSSALDVFCAFLLVINAVIIGATLGMHSACIMNKNMPVMIVMGCGAGVTAILAITHLFVLYRLRRMHLFS